MDYLVDYAELLSAPRWDWLQVEISGRCNAACSYCPLSCYKAAWDGDLMGEDTFERLVPEFRRADLVYLQGWGEPLLHPRFWDMARSVKSAGTRAGFTTNGTCLNRACLLKVLDTPIDILAVSIAGATEATSDHWRAGNDFTRLGTSLENLKRMKSERRADRPRVHIAYMLLASNWRDLENLPALAHTWGVSQVVVDNLNFIGSSEIERESLFERPDLWEPVLAALGSAKERARALGIELYYHRPDSQDRHSACTENVLRSCFVSYRGDVSPCVLTNLSTRETSAPRHFFRGRAYPVERLVFGNVRQQNLGEIWHSAQARAFRAAFERHLTQQRPGPSGLPGPCRQCYKLFELSE
jgi:MoaA/NifB/PqqE/SkfB family radical SAM enzyme